jgi:hypothetical protein
MLEIWAVRFTRDAPLAQVAIVGAGAAFNLALAVFLLWRNP